MVKFLENLNSIKIDLNLHKKSKNEVLIDLMQERLTGSLKNYYTELNRAVDRLAIANENKLDRNLDEDRYIRRFK